MKITDLNPFTRRNHMDNIIKELAILTARRDALLAKQSAAKVALDRALADQTRHMMEGNIDDEALDIKRQAAVDRAESALKSFAVPLAGLASKVTDAQARLTKETQAVAAGKASIKLGKQTDVVENCSVRWLESTRLFITALDTVGPVRFEMAQIGGFLRGVCSEVEMAVDVGLPALRDTVNHVRDGLAPIPQEATAPIAKPPSPPKPVTKRVFATHALTWLDAGGQQRTIGKWYDVELPEAAADYALSVGLAVLPNDPMSAKARGQAQGHPQSSWLNDLDNHIGPNIAGSQPAQPAAQQFIRREANRPPFVVNNREGRRS
jgi:hypothetical protein